MQKVSAPLTVLDKGVEIIGGFCLIASFVIPIIFFQKLPSTIPVHFNIGGLPDGYGSRWHLFIIAGIGGVVYAFLFFIKRYSIHMNYPIPVTPQNKDRLLSLTLQMMRWIRLIVAALFLMMVISMVRVGLGETTQADVYIVVYFLLAVAAIVGIHVYQMIMQHQEPAD